MKIFLSLSILLGIMLNVSCSTVPNLTVEEKRKVIDDMGNATLQDLYALKDSARQEVEAAPGYAIFNSGGVKLLVVSAGVGRGVAVDNHTGRRTYMNMAEVGGGLGIGVKDVRAVFVFHNRDAMTDFLTNGVTIGASADAAIKAKDVGEAGGGKVVLNDMSVYQITDSGLALDLMISGTKYWEDQELNLGLQ